MNVTLYMKWTSNRSHALKIYFSWKFQLTFTRLIPRILAFHIFRNDDASKREEIDTSSNIHAYARAHADTRKNYIRIIFVIITAHNILDWNENKWVNEGGREREIWIGGWSCFYMRKHTILAHIDTAMVSKNHWSTSICDFLFDFLIKHETLCVYIHFTQGTQWIHTHKF